MSGFFRKLFNRITGKKEDEAPATEEAKVLPAPAPVIIETPKPVEPASAKVKPKKPEQKPKAKPEPKAKAKIQPKPRPKAKPESKPKTKSYPDSDLPPVGRSKFAAQTSGGGLVVEPERPPPLIPPHKGEGEFRPEPAPMERKGWLSRLKAGLSKSSKTITGSIATIFTKRKLDSETLGELEDVLIQADLGLVMAERIVKAVSAGRYDKEIEPEEVKRILAEEVAKVLKPVEVPFNFGTEKPFVILVVGVNGSGKTTTIGKLGAIAKSEGFKVMFAACDTFRAAAIEQLAIWGQRIGATTVSRPTGSDSSGLAFDAMKQACEDGTDILFIDTAGRLQNKAYLMDELDKVVRVVKKQDASAPHAVLLVLDATTGQNAVAQAEVFTKVAGVTGLIMTKLDGTARGGILVAIAEKFKLPVHAIGVGERIDDLQPFEAEAFARAIAGLEDR
ncbi:MAG: signal recognition particle-docking protein FtsY [Aestuariivirga sp.]